MRILAILATTLALAACQSRQASPAQMSQAGDARLECAQIRSMQAANRREAARLAKLDEGVAIGNAVAVGLSKVWFWPAVMGVDMSDVEEIEARALLDRNRRLAEIGRAKGCAQTEETAEAPLKKS